MVTPRPAGPLLPTAWAQWSHVPSRSFLAVSTSYSSCACWPTCVSCTAQLTRHLFAESRISREKVASHAACPSEDAFGSTMWQRIFYWTSLRGAVWQCRLHCLHKKPKRNFWDKKSPLGLIVVIPDLGQRNTYVHTECTPKDHITNELLQAGRWIKNPYAFVLFPNKFLLYKISVSPVRWIMTELALISETPLRLL